MKNTPFDKVGYIIRIIIALGTAFLGVLGNHHHNGGDEEA